jgi:ubiquinone/menaquinone biosynthesis C-methylase UbiE
MTVLEPGPGMGFFTLELARLVGPAGRVVAVDVQRKMLDGLMRRARRAGLSGRIDPRQTVEGGMGVADLTGAVDFVLAFAVVHELPDQARFFTETSRVLKTGSRMLLSEPAHHVTRPSFEQTLTIANSAGLALENTVSLRSSHAAVLVRRPGAIHE